MDVDVDVDADVWMLMCCLYFQNQQQSYMVNRHNAQNPSSPIVIDNARQWVKNLPTPEDVSNEEADPHDNLSVYEL